MRLSSYEVIELTNIDYWCARCYFPDVANLLTNIFNGTQNHVFGLRRFRANRNCRQIKGFAQSCNCMGKSSASAYAHQMYFGKNYTSNEKNRQAQKTLLNNVNTLNFTTVGGHGSWPLNESSFKERWNYNFTLITHFIKKNKKYFICCNGQ